MKRSKRYDFFNNCAVHLTSDVHANVPGNARKSTNSVTAEHA